MSQNLNRAITVVGIDIGKNSFHLVGLDDRGASVPSSSIPIKRQEPATSAARIAASRRSTCSLLKMHPRGSGKLNVHIAQL